MHFKGLTFPLTSRHTLYHEFNQKLSCTGAGLEYSDINPESDIYNLIDALSV
jgi:hypothetical protein